MRATIFSLLAEPMMLAAQALPALIEEAKAEARANVEPPKPPTLNVSLYALDGERVTGNDRRPPGSLVACVPLSGVLTRHGYQSWFGASIGTVDIARQLEALDADESVGGIVLAVHSPGGTVTGTPELAATVYGIRERGRTRIVSVADSMAASAGIYIATAAESLYAIPSATVGSVGVLNSYADASRMYERLGIDHTIVRTPAGKARFSGVEPMTDSMLATMQKGVDEAYAEFVASMARHRGVSERHVTKRFGGGETLTSQEALSVGMIDGIVGGVDEVLASMVRTIATQGGRSRRGRGA